MAKGTDLINISAEVAQKVTDYMDEVVDQTKPVVQDAKSRSEEIKLKLENEGK